MCLVGRETLLNQSIQDSLAAKSAKSDAVQLPRVKPSTEQRSFAVIAVAVSLPTSPRDKTLNYQARPVQTVLHHARSLLRVTCPAYLMNIVESVSGDQTCSVLRSTSSTGLLDNSRTRQLADCQLADATGNFACLVFVLLAASARPRVVQSTSCLDRELSSPRLVQSTSCLDREMPSPRVGVSASCPLTVDGLRAATTEHKVP